ncbi:uncharacterized protein PgNI_11908 [Pyricularia grisea]|uniref:Uncharacterized protein n=1 Tax=Pyricularia grisea TaxID=148305 RepID=A0A6P8AR27_PYRGI|nr:uncharacterized protein PgNI_11908 [Pyricularia grisea]TLD04496.1 hypothetical protein PgNI_11908 [Pyricularia grisea]
MADVDDLDRWRYGWGTARSHFDMRPVSRTVTFHEAFLDESINGLMRTGGGIIATGQIQRSPRGEVGQGQHSALATEDRTTTGTEIDKVLTDLLMLWRGFFTSRKPGKLGEYILAIPT